MKSNVTTHPSEIKTIVKQAIKRTGQQTDIELDYQMASMTKLEVMDHYLDWYGEKISSFEICTVVKHLFGFDLTAIPIVSTEKIGSFVVPSLPATNTASSLIDFYLNQDSKQQSGADIRKMIDHFFGVNLNGVASLEKARISLYSKGQWVVQQHHDLFVVYTGIGDVDVRVSATDYFTAQTGLKELPNDLRQALLRLGYTYEEEMGSAYFSNPSGQAVPDSFKGQTIGAIIEVIHGSYSGVR